jgi:AcrR family transcriptional regulator
MNTKEKVLQVSEKIILEKGMHALKLADIAEEIGISQAALYKHFTNKQAILSSLAWSWLDRLLTDVWTFTPNSENDSVDVIVHDWLWLLISSKYQVYQQSPKMFELYSTYIVGDDILLQKYLARAQHALATAASLKNEQDALNLLLSVIAFDDPGLNHVFSKPIHDNFESMWRLLAPGVQQLERTI